MTNLKPVNTGMNHYCGPAVLSILTGKNTDDCVDAIRRVYPQYSGAEVPYSVLLQAADWLGYDTPTADKGISLYGTIVRLAKQDGIYVILVHRHVVVIEVASKIAYFCDNHTKEPIPASSSARLGQRVLAVNKFVERPKPVFLRHTYTVDINQPSKLIVFQKTAVYNNPKYNVNKFTRTMPFDDLEDVTYILEAFKSAFSKAVE